MMNIFEWIVWSFFLGIILLSGCLWRVKREEFKSGLMDDKDLVSFMKGFPFIAFFETVILILFVLMNVNKLNLLWIFPWVWYLVVKKYGWGKK